LRAFSWGAILLVFALPLSAFAGFDPAPTESLACQITAFPLANDFEIPQHAFHPQVLSLSSTQTTNSASWQLAKLNLKKTHKNFYSGWALDPWDHLYPEETLFYVSHSILEKSHIELKLERFPADNTRVAGLSAELHVEGGFRATYLIVPATDNPVFNIESPVRDANQSIIGYVHLNCLTL
jgi:hypothetical protein